jgi:hypothetical protein
VQERDFLNEKTETRPHTINSHYPKILGILVLFRG